MCEYKPQSILAGLEDEIEATPPEQPEPMCGDRWLAASAMQKGIRRGETDRAIRAATALWQQDRQAFWRRLHIIALEDIGIGNTLLLIQTLTAVSSSAWRRRCNDLRVGLFLTRKLAESVKCRMADELFIQCERAPQFAGLRERFAVAKDETLAGYVADERSDLVTRALSLWLIAGTRKYPSDLMPARKGEPADAIEMLRSLTAPVELVESCIAVASRTPWPLSIFTPLIWQAVNSQPERPTIRSEAIPLMPDVEGIPLYACDMFTRTGGASYRQLQRAVPELKRYSTRQVGLAIFYAEGGKLDRVLTSPYLDAFRDAGEASDIEGNGLDLASYMGLRETLSANMELLQEIRSERLQHYLDGVAA